ncbi:alcohol dehydrogenase catalytic domain-containing protein [Pseudomonas rubra]|uniref:Oxidoreductase n=1 Tax=Pseudomonas rubra TaxID=2942627 RepID=A0ABT5P347_9PSED|nr:oxidoreductase [Pseudomonas rubra]MDD1012701.1 oxidoreductase [Pseudomonas rubra]MDD1041591.1 oxidoreductase [Pseudomonas rubra]MDD1155527.1 oxidoreductase [Pseudomonas rubra]
MNRLRYTLTACGADGVQRLQASLRAPAPTEVQVAVDYTLVSPGTERHYIRQVARSGEQLPLGYCAAGVVSGVGAQVDQFTPGDRVVAMGWNIATHSNWINVPQRLVCRVPDALSLDQAVLATLGATAVHAADRGQLEEGEQILVVGMGPVGKLLSLVAARRKVQVWAADLNPHAIEAGLPLRTLDLQGDLQALSGHFSTIFLCIDADITALLPRLISLLNPQGKGRGRSRLVNVGRVSLSLELSPQLGNVDIVNASRCGTGYRDDDYHHGRKSLRSVPGESTVDHNIARCLDDLVHSQLWLDCLRREQQPVTQALLSYNSAAFFAPGIQLINHQEG